MKFLLLLSMASLCLGCSLFKNAKTTVEKSHQLSESESKLQVSEHKDWLSNSKSLFFTRDTNNSNYSVQIWPEGAFSFSPDKGFSGHANQILINGKANGSSVTSSLHVSRQEDKGIVISKISAKDKQVNNHDVKTKTSSPSWKWMVTGLGLIIIGCWWLYRKLTEKLHY